MLIMSGKLKNILLTWDTRWIWNDIRELLISDFNIIWVSRNDSDIKCDLTNIDRLTEVVDFIERNNYTLDAVVFNAWMWYFGDYFSWTTNEYTDIINLNLLSPIILLKLLKKYIKKDCKIIFIWSIISKKFFSWAAVYQASKFWIRWFAWALKKELWKNIHIINPSIVDTDFHKNSKIELKSHYNKTNKSDISKTLLSILIWEEKRFEIDL